MSDLQSFLEVAEPGLEGHQGSILPAMEPVGEQTSLGQFDDLLCQGDSSSLNEVLQQHEVESENPPTSVALQNQSENLTLNEGSENAVGEGLQSVSSPTEGTTGRLDETFSPLQTDETRINLLPSSGALDIAARRSLLLGKKQRHVCHVCGRECPSKHKLKRHLSTHSQDRPFNCHICGKNFKWTEYLAKHMRQQHSGAVAEDGHHESTASTASATSPTSSSQQPSQSHYQSSALTGTEDHVSSMDVSTEARMDTASVDTSLENSSTLDNSALLGNQDAFAEDLQQHSDSASHLEAMSTPMPASAVSLPETVVTQPQQPQLMSPDPMQTQPADSSILQPMLSQPPPELIPVPPNQLAMERIPVTDTASLQQSLLPFEGAPPNQTPPLPPNLLPLEGGSSNVNPPLQSHLLVSLEGVSPSNTPPLQLPLEGVVPNTTPMLQSNLLSLHDSISHQGHASQAQLVQQLPPVSAAEIMSQLGIQLPEDSAQQLLSPAQLRLEQPVPVNAMVTASNGDNYAMVSSRPYAAVSSSEGYGTASGDSFYATATNESYYVAASGEGYIAPNSGSFVASSSNGYVALGSDGYVATSSDGYVATSSDGYVATSSDGYVAPSSNGYIATNADGYVVASTDTYMAASAEGSIPSDPAMANFSQGMSLPVATFPADIATQLQTQATNTAVNMISSMPHQINASVDMNQLYNYDNFGIVQNAPFVATAQPVTVGFTATASSMPSSQEIMQSTAQLLSQLQSQPALSPQSQQPRTIIVREEIEVVREPPAKRSKNETVSVGIQCEVGQETVAALREEERVAKAQGIYSNAELEIEANAIRMPDNGDQSVAILGREAYAEGGGQYGTSNGAGNQEHSSGDVLLGPSNPFSHEEKVVQKYPCELETCSKAYIHRKDLIRHMKVRHGISPQKLEPVVVENPEKPYTCPVSGCGRSYCHLKDLRRHQRQCHTVSLTSADEAMCETVEGEGKSMLRFPCDFPGCMRSYVHKKDLVRHKRLYHNDASSKPSVPIPVRYTEAELKRIKQEEKVERAAEGEDKLDRLEKQRLTSTGSTISNSGTEDPPNSATLMETDHNHVLPDAANLASLAPSRIMENLTINANVATAGGHLASHAQSPASAFLASPDSTMASSLLNPAAPMSSDRPPTIIPRETISDGRVLRQESLSPHSFIGQSLEKSQLPNATTAGDLTAVTNQAISEISHGGVYPSTTSISYNMGTLEAFNGTSGGNIIYGFSQQSETTTSSLQQQQQDGNSAQYDPTAVLNVPLSTSNTQASSLQSVVSELQLFGSSQGVSQLSQGSF